MKKERSQQGEQNPKSPPTREETYLIKTFKNLFIDVTNNAMTNILHNGHFFYNFFLISISASGVLTL